ncbi:hypothetical protein JHK82_027332 [Glycine max]|uniref:START domain-containing protein n=2 Tax=Glycine subgen. Soja TaxID=1462606 RepID=K7LI37_SOYBN|nr:uncharacterized protein LOC100798284 [Glycine max]XP_006588883.1 uncharacterized protein LOC100798284 [Glycine max]XP_028184375.1 uncharacterized protein LOC114371144 [Glycine soja]XP_028184376.1 uncharacterized protein LOC114371144 [Glycine soja]XP_040862000.1 uncharacterized protein LOC100798284 [Glycine max]KAG4982485.1 hypothetical protein JHK87_027234 [Glycine soja]KAG5126497.1 hypothetical protein JHK82_027332 [Glycine max]KAH1137351.1 hypothetical protein GYH30_027370 [Glycine max]|eukprot:XP_003535828.1 uncharacterized protein LOC100798284 [Glycine max]
MEKKRKIVQYRERLDRTLASPDLANDEMLKKLVRSQLPPLEPEVEGFRDKLVENKTAEVSHFLDMLRSASSDDSGRSNTSHTDWKLKQDGEEFRVMYREGQEGTPFHTMLVEGFVDGPVDVCLCISWETYLYKKWWPQSTIPTFKILSAECLQKARIGEQLSLVRVKVSWPLSLREAIVHYYLFEYFQDDLVVVLTNSVSDSKNVTETLCGFNSEAIPEAKDVVRIDLVGGFALQKVTSERSYFRTIANMDIKLNFVPPSLINFISRQLIGNGFRLYQKTVSSMMSHDKGEFSKALGDPLYVRIRDALYNTSGSKAMNGEELRQVASVLPAEDLVESEQGGEKDASKEDMSNQYANDVMPMAMNIEVQDSSKTFNEIVEVDCEEIVQGEEKDASKEDISYRYANNVVPMAMNTKVLDGSKKFAEIVEVDIDEILQIEEANEEVKDIPNKEVDMSVLRGKRSTYIRSEVEHALETLDKAISMVREQRLHSRVASSSVADEESHFLKNDDRVDTYSLKLTQPSSKNEVSVEVPNGDIPEGASQEALGNNPGIQNSRCTGTNPNSKEVNSNKVVPTTSEQNLSTPILSSPVVSYPLENGAILDQTTISNKQLNTDSVEDASLDHADKSSRQKKLNTIVIPGRNSDAPKKLSRQKKFLLFSALTRGKKS